MSDTLHLARNALHYINADDRITWIRMGAALKTQFGDQGFDLWREWSQSSAKYDAKVAVAQWRTLKPGRINIGTLFYEARQNGFEHKKALQEIGVENYKPQKIQKAAEDDGLNAERIKKSLKAAEISQERIKQGKSIDFNHPYLQKKGMGEFKFLANYLKQDEKNNLLVPIKSYGSIIGCQRITYTGAKFLEKDMILEGRSLLLGKWSDIKQEGVIVAEGLATGATIHAATKKPVVIAFSGANLPTVCKLLRGSNIRNIYVAADIDKDGLKVAEQARENTKREAIILKPLFSEKDIQQFEAKNKSTPTDFNDYYQIHGLKKVRELITEQMKISKQNIFSQAVSAVKNEPMKVKSDTTKSMKL